MKLCRWIVFPIIILVSFSCEKKENQTVSQYSSSINWLSKPSPEKEVDIFYVYPTTWQRTPQYSSNICPIDYPMMKSGAQTAYSRQATAFETTGNIYAPYYRQLDATYALSLSDEERWNEIKKTPAKDITEAFDYYIKNINNGRPFILAGHSQGANVLLVLLSDYMKQHSDVYKRMIAAYAIGYPVTKRYMTENSHLKFATGPDDTGVIISYNTQSPKVHFGNNPVMGKSVGLVINPITWTTSEEVAKTSQGLGSLMPDPTTNLFTKVPQYADARIDRAHGVLICSTADETSILKLSSSMGLGVYHRFDYPFYYFNIRQNAENRANIFLSQQNKL